MPPADRGADVVEALALAPGVVHHVGADVAGRWSAPARAELVADVVVAQVVLAVGLHVADGLVVVGVALDLVDLDVRGADRVDGRERDLRHAEVDAGNRKRDDPAVQPHDEVRRFARRGAASAVEHLKNLPRRVGLDSQVARSKQLSERSD